MSKRRRKSSLHLTGPLIVWLALQLIVLGIGAGGIPLASNWPRPPESLAIDEMLFAQLAIASMLFPFLLRSVWTTLAVILTSLPMLQIAGFLSTTPMDRLLPAAGFLVLWIVALMLLRFALNERWRMLGVAAATLFTLGGAVMWYIGSDFRHAPPGLSQLTPVPAAARLLHEDVRSMQPWLSVLIPLALAVVGIIMRVSLRPSNQPQDTTEPT